jgi:hypothetical protein
MKQILCGVFMLALLMQPACANKTSAPEVNVLHTTTNVVEAATALQRGITNATDAGVLPVATAQTLTGYMEKLHADATVVVEKVQVYHTATSVSLKASNAAEIQTLVGKMNTLIGQVLGTALPESAATELMKLIGTVMTSIGAVQAEVAKGLS